MPFALDERPGVSHCPTKRRSFSLKTSVHSCSMFSGYFCSLTLKLHGSIDPRPSANDSCVIIRDMKMQTAHVPFNDKQRDVDIGHNFNVQLIQINSTPHIGRYSRVRQPRSSPKLPNTCQFKVLLHLPPFDRNSMPSYSPLNSTPVLGGSGRPRGSKLVPIEISSPHSYWTSIYTVHTPSSYLTPFSHNA